MSEASNYQEPPDGGSDQRPVRPCECFGLKTVIEVYPDDKGEGWLSINGEELIKGDRHTVKEHCHECGQTYLRTQTFPPAFQ